MTGIYVEEFYDSEYNQMLFRFSLGRYSYLVNRTMEGNIPVIGFQLAKRVLEARILEDEQQKRAKIGMSIGEPERIRNWSIFRS